MNKIIIILLSILFLASCTTLTPYDSNEVKTSMQTILGSVKSISGSLEAGDLATAPMDFMILKDEFKKLSKMEAPRGSSEEWTMMNKEMYSLSVDGKKAAEMGDAEKVGMIMGKLFELQKKGHADYKD